MNICTQCRLFNTHGIPILIGTECIHAYLSSQKSHGMNQSILVQHSVTTIVSLSMSSMHISNQKLTIAKMHICKTLRILLRVAFFSIEQQMSRFVALHIHCVKHHSWSWAQDLFNLITTHIKLSLKHISVPHKCWFDLLAFCNWFNQLQTSTCDIELSLIICKSIWLQA